VTSIRIQVTAEDCAAAVDYVDPGDPIELAIARVAGVGCNVDRDVPDGYMATIGPEGPGSTLVVNLPAEVDARLDAWWDHGKRIAEPFDFALELDDWLVDFFRSAE